MATPGIELPAFWSGVRRDNHQTTEPLIFCSSNNYICVDKISLIFSDHFLAKLAAFSKKAFLKIQSNTWFLGAYGLDFELYASFLK